ncbi:type 2 periplasmic-binding domain-containing protein [Streptosporangium soli]|nr:hypothetical protein [Streptosporangium sp. KLBMP 9127]
MTGLRGLTWDHPRGYAPLEEFARRSGGLVHWERQPLEGFESTPIADLAREYDLLVIDHPGLGTAVDSLVPMDELFGKTELTDLRTGTAGRSFDSYTFDGRTWALPLDAAAQVSVARPGVPRPATWEEAHELARELAGSTPIALCLGGPHAFLMFCSLVVAQGELPFTDGTVASGEAGSAALDLMAGLLSLADAELSVLNPIGVLEAMSAPGGPAYCPLVYGYVNYQGPLAFGDAPVWRPHGRRGSVLGGTGLAVSRRAVNAADSTGDLVRDVLRRLTGETVQRELFPATGGQPASLVAWTDAEVDAASGGFYRDTLATVLTAWVRPRFPGYIAFQDAASRLLRDGLIAGTPHGALLDELAKRYHDWRRP